MLFCNIGFFKSTQTAYILGIHIHDVNIIPYTKLIDGFSNVLLVVQNTGEFEGALAPSFYSPPSLAREGGQGDRLLRICFRPPLTNDLLTR